MAELDADAKIEFLLDPDIRGLLGRLCRDPRDDLALSQSPELRGIPAPRRIALLEQRKLRLKALRKSPEAPEMIFTALGLEQFTQAELARYKAGRLPIGLDSLADLCCGLGGDSLYVPSNIRLCGLDSSRATLKAYRHNVSRMRPVGVVQGDAASGAVRAEAALLDPSRRQAGRVERWQEAGLSPGWEAMEALIARYGSMSIKLGPGMPLPEFLEAYEWEYLGLRDECLEVTIWTGQLGRPGLVKATELPSGFSIEALRADIPDSFSESSSPGAYLFEPVKAVVRAHLFGVLASGQGLWQIDPRIAYLSGNDSIRHPLLKTYRILRQLPYDMKAIKEFLRKEEVGRLEVKKRGVNLIPEDFRAGLKLAGGNEGTLIFTKEMDRKTAFWTRAEA